MKKLEYGGVAEGWTDKEASFENGGEIKEIAKMKKSLIAKAKSRGLYENFGQKEVRKLEDKYGRNNNNIREFDKWASHFDLSQLEDGGAVEKKKKGGSAGNGGMMAKIQSGAKALRAEHPSMKWTDCIKKSAANLKAKGELHN